MVRRPVGKQHYLPKSIQGWTLVCISAVAVCQQKKALPDLSGCREMV
jgi:hypothetical protein